MPEDTRERISASAALRGTSRPSIRFRLHLVDDEVSTWREPQLDPGFPAEIDAAEGGDRRQGGRPSSPESAGLTSDPSTAAALVTWQVRCACAECWTS